MSMNSLVRDAVLFAEYARVRAQETARDVHECPECFGIGQIQVIDYTPVYDYNYRWCGEHETMEVIPCPVCSQSGRQGTPSGCLCDRCGRAVLPSQCVDGLCEECGSVPRSV